jgi:FecR protein
MNDHDDNKSASRQSAPELATDVAHLVRLAEPRQEIGAERLRCMQEDLRPLWTDQVRRRSGALRRPLLVAAGLVVLAGASAFLARSILHQEPRPLVTVARIDGAANAWSETGAGVVETLSPGASIPAGRSVATAADARVALETPTGRSLRLDRDSRIVLVSEREIRLEHGAVYLDSGADRPSEATLTVLTSLGVVQEVGTQFEVRLSADTLTVRVREGHVSLGNDRERAAAGAGEELTLSAGRLSRRPIPIDSSAFDWAQSIAPTWQLDGSRLSDFLAWAARESGRRLRYAPPPLAAETSEVLLRGDIRGLSPLEALEVVLPAVDLGYRIEAGELVVQSADDSADESGAS